DGPLHRNVPRGEYGGAARHQRLIELAAIDREILVQPPACRDVVDNDVAGLWIAEVVAVGAVAAEGVIAAIDVDQATAKAHVADDNVVDVDTDRFAGDGDAVARGGLPGNGQVGIGDAQLAIEIDLPGDIEHHGTGPVGRRGSTEASRPGVVEIGDS